MPTTQALAVDIAVAVGFIRVFVGVGCVIKGLMALAVSQKF